MRITPIAKLRRTTKVLIADIKSTDIPDLTINNHNLPVITEVQTEITKV
jgi:hypothetical protein